jgi:hypothetical protein
MGIVIDFAVFVGSYILLGGFIFFIVTRIWPD